MSKLYDLLYSVIDKVNKSIKTESQNLTDEQKNQARANIGADPEGTAESAVSEHDSDGSAHSDIRQAITDINTNKPDLANSEIDTLTATIQ